MYLGVGRCCLAPNVLKRIFPSFVYLKSDRTQRRSKRQKCVFYVVRSYNRCNNNKTNISALFERNRSVSRILKPGVNFSFCLVFKCGGVNIKNLSLLFYFEYLKCLLKNMKQFLV